MTSCMLQVASPNSADIMTTLLYHRVACPCQAFRECLTTFRNNTAQQKLAPGKADDAQRATFGMERHIGGHPVWYCMCVARSHPILVGNEAICDAVCHERQSKLSLCGCI